MLFFIAIAIPAFGDTTTIEGKITGYDGKPLPMAQVTLTRFLAKYRSPTGEIKKLAHADVAPDGSYRLQTADTGLLKLEITGVGCYECDLPVRVEPHVHITMSVQLKPYEYYDTIDSVEIVGYSRRYFSPVSQMMKKNTDGTFSAEFVAKGDTFAYELKGIENTGRGVNGTQSDSYMYDGDGDYRSVVHVQNDTARIVFDPKLLHRVHGTVNVVSQPQDMSDFATTYQDVKKREDNFDEFATENRYLQATLKTEGKKQLNEIVAKIEHEKDPSIRELWYLAYFHIGECGIMFHDPIGDSVFAQQGLKEISPSSPMWGLEGADVAYAAAVAGTGAGLDYFNTFLDRYPDSTAKGLSLLKLLGILKVAGLHHLQEVYYKRVMNDYASSSMWSEAAKAYYDPDARVVEGSIIPAFSVHSVDDSSVVFTDQSLRGKYYLIDLWATWCGPCVGEMPTLHNAFQKFKGRNFDILSISMDESSSSVVAFHKKKWKMPWHNAFSEGIWNSAIAKTFEVLAIPKPMLVDPTGKIIAMGTDLRGPELEKTLEYFLPKN